jgi:hypothetical protein
MLCFTPWRVLISLDGEKGVREMNTRFLRPSVVWGGIWIAFLLLIFSIAYWQSKLYWKDSIERVQKQEFKMLHAILPYAVAFLEEHGQIGQIQGALQPDQDLFTLVYTDLAGAIKYRSRPPVPRR